MNFTRISKFFLESDCGRYSVSRTPDRHGEHEYKAWHKLEQVGGPYTNSADAKDACIKHRERKSA